MFHGRKKVKKIVIKRVLKIFLGKVDWKSVLFGNFTEKKLVISK